MVVACMCGIVSIKQLLQGKSACGDNGQATRTSSDGQLCRIYLLDISISVVDMRTRQRHIRNQRLLTSTVQTESAGRLFELASAWFLYIAERHRANPVHGAAVASSGSCRWPDASGRPERPEWVHAWSMLSCSPPRIFEPVHCRTRPHKISNFGFLYWDKLGWRSLCPVTPGPHDWYW